MHLSVKIRYQINWTKATGSENLTQGSNYLHTVIVIFFSLRVEDVIVYFYKIWNNLTLDNLDFPCKVYFDRRK